MSNWASTEPGDSEQQWKLRALAAAWEVARQRTTAETDAMTAADAEVVVADAERRLRPFTDRPETEALLARARARRDELLASSPTHGASG